MKTKVKTQVVQRLKELGHTQNSLAKHIGVPPSNLSVALSRGFFPKTALWLRILDALDLEVQVVPKKKRDI